MLLARTGVSQKGVSRNLAFQKSMFFKTTLINYFKNIKNFSKKKFRYKVACRVPCDFLIIESSCEDRNTLKLIFIQFLCTFSRRNVQ